MHHYKQADRQYKKALEQRLEGNNLKAEHYMRLAQGHFKNAEYHNRESAKNHKEFLLA